MRKRYIIGLVTAVLFISAYGAYHVYKSVALVELTDENTTETANSEDFPNVEIIEVKSDGRLLPDLVPLPPQDLEIVMDGGRTLLVFSTTYYNIGEGTLELIADPETATDTERTVFQRIYKTDGTYTDRDSGMFLWHQPHLHYHFSDFVDYALEPVNSGESKVSGIREKSTFCIRDVSRVEIEGSFTEEPAKYVVCGKERQGVSVGWGDTYFSDYPDQNMDITNIPSGTYTLSFDVNPLDRFDEITKENNISSVTFNLNKELGNVDIISTYPENPPEFEHIHIEQEF